MNRFGTVAEAKEYLISRILAQADRDGIPLSELERKIMYFSETGCTLPDMMSINREFDQSYDQNEYERKIGQVIRRVHDDPNSQPDDIWDEAVARVRDEDQYLLVLIDNARRKPFKRTRSDTVRLILTALVASALAIPLIAFISSHIDNPITAKWIGSGALLALGLLAVYVGNRSRRGSA